MQVIRGHRGLAPEERGATAALGNFDGVHKGHQALLAAARAAGPDRPLAVVTFEPHPRRFFQPDAPPFRLTTPAERARVLAGHGVDRVHEIVFDATLAATEPEPFVEEILGAGLGLAHVAIGEDFRFGRARRGDAAMLAAIGRTVGMGVTRLGAVEGPRGRYSSSAIRRAVAEGRCADAALQLGRWHTVSGPVIAGDRRGRALGYPTANLAFDEQVVPRFGVYAAEVTVHDGPHAGRHDGVASIGERPTFGVNAPNFEVHLFDFDGDLYGAEISAGLVAFLRPEVAYEGPEALIAQMDRDAAAAREALARAARPG
jgi:riboflavin kinase/FMN adenylyltransferase